MQWRCGMAYPLFGPLAQGSGVASRLGFINNDGLRGIEAWWTSAIFDNGRSDISGSRVQSPTVKWQPGLRPWVMNFCNAPPALQRQTTPRRATASTGNPNMTTPHFSLWRMSTSIFLGSARGSRYSRAESGTAFDIYAAPDCVDGRKAPSIGR